MNFNIFVQQCNLIKSRLETIKKQVEDLSSKTVIEELNTQELNKLKLLCKQSETKHTEFEALTNKLYSETQSVQDIDVKIMNTLQDEISDLYINITSVGEAFSLDCNENEENVIHQQFQGNNPTIRLPKISLPHFSGQPDQWITFQGMFETAIHSNQSISNIEKFTYLRSCLSDEPLNLVKSLPLNNDNYQIAWENLIKRYHNTRLLISLHINNILDLPILHKPNVRQIRDFISTYNDNYQALKALNHDIAINENLILTSHLLRKFDIVFRTEFENKRDNPKEIPTINELIQFLENECSQKEAVSLNNLTSIPQGKHKDLVQSKHNTLTTSIGNDVTFSNRSYMSQNCTYCNLPHKIFQCGKFKTITPKERHEFIKSKDLCLNCFGKHKTGFCKSQHSCRVCMKRHHSLLHFNKTDQVPASNTQQFDRSLNNHTLQTLVDKDTLSNSNNIVPANSANTSTFVNSSQSSTVLLATALVNVSTQSGHSIVVRAVLDSASQTTIMSEYCANMLRVQRTYSRVPEITGISSAQVQPKGLTFVNLSSISGKTLANLHPVLILDKISNSLPHVQLSPTIKDKLCVYFLADPTFDKPGPIDLLIGADLFAQILIGPSVDLGEGMPYVINTTFGHVLLGNTPIDNSSHFSGISTLLSLNEMDLHTTIQHFWSIEEPPQSTKVCPQDIECEKHFLNNHSRDTSGRYICRIPFKENPSNLGDSANVAKRSFISLERKLQSNPELKHKYIEFMNDYQTSGHMKLSDINTFLKKPHYVLPHHGVVKDNKIRVVFNASTPTSTGITLNSIQHQGPKLHNEISNIILRFRQYKIAFTCDIKQMFRMISIHEDDQCFQLIYWRDNPALPLNIYQLTTVTYGMTSSPFLANRVIQELIKEEESHHPIASKVLPHQIYVDDALLGGDSVEEALTLQNDVISLLKKGGFELRKWTSNCEDILDNVPKEHCITTVSLDKSCISILGLKWDPNSDTFSYSIETPSETFTKRTVLSTISRIYDVTGMLTPLIFWAKALMQHIWSLGIGWDTIIPSEVADRWSTFISELPLIESLKISRYLSVTDAISIQLHGFADASELGFAACVYLRTEDRQGNVKISLLIAKSKVAPLKRVTIPRLELCATHLLAKLLHYCLEQFSNHYAIESITAWSDSTIALSWIHTPPYRLKLFVANRVSQIQELTPSCIWKHVSTQHNPADCASRGLTASNLIHNEKWWFGPHWLKTSPLLWPESDFNYHEETLPETKPLTFNLMTTNKVKSLDFINKFSSWNTLLYVMGYVLRFIACLKSKKRMTHPFTNKELEESEQRICLYIQAESFPEEFKLLSKNKMCSSRLQRLSPFLDNSGLMRVGGRLNNSNLSYASKHQIILPKKHVVVDILIDHYHKFYLHLGPQQLQAVLREKFWILNARCIIRSRIFKCLRCYRTKPKITAPLMGDLPSGRLIPSRCFNTSGVDYAGPFNVKLYRLRKIQPIKVYLCLFICFTSKAIHLEVVTDLTTDAFIASLTRFISRRGLVSDLYSDCGTNFIGTASTLKNCFQELMQHPDLQKFAKNNSVNFHFIPARAPHHGGLWERAVKSAKYHLTRVIGEQILTYEEFITLTARVEAILNSRPITQLSADPNDLQPLTPGHFLTGGPLISLIEPHLTQDPLSRLQRWRLVQAFAQHLWNRWQKEYLHTLQERSKWVKGQDNLKVGELVVIHEDNTPPLSWKMGRIVAVSPGKDGIVRVVHLKTSSNKTLTRSVVKVSRLPID